MNDSDSVNDGAVSGSIEPASAPAAALPGVAGLSGVATAGAAEPIDTVVFDFGNVLVHWDFTRAFSDLDPAEVQAFLDSFDFAAFNHLQDAGRPLEDGIAAVAAETPRWAPFIRHYADHYPATLTGLVDGAQALVEELKDAGYRVYGLSNWWKELFHYAEQAIPALALMDGIVVSGYVGLAKPDRAIYDLLCQRFDITPARAVFTDDRLDNCAGARTSGLHALPFTSTPALRQDLAALGVNVACEESPSR
ncbi:MAG: HAD family phosphatase [Cellulomonadaceae bacterium]|nr:HAD family phosphatase [Cellulomonadaceae bacterium]